MEVLEAIYERRAVRAFTPAPVDELDLEAVIDAAIQAPSGMNRQPWAFVIVDSREALGRVSALCKAHLLEQSALDPRLAAARDHLASPGVDILHQAPLLLLVCATESDPMAAKDCCLAAQNLMLAAVDRGLGSCWIGFCEPWLNTPEGKAALAIPPEFVVVAPLVLGHPAARPTAPPRRAARILRSPS